MPYYPVLDFLPDSHHTIPGFWEPSQDPDGERNLMSSVKNYDIGLQEEV